MKYAWEISDKPSMLRLSLTGRVRDLYASREARALGFHPSEAYITLRFANYDLTAGDINMPSFWTLAKIVAGQILGPNKPHNASCRKCGRSFHKSSFVDGLCPLCQPQSAGNDSPPEKRAQCRRCGRSLHPDGLKEGTCLECWLTIWQRQSTRPEERMTLPRAYKSLDVRKIVLWRKSGDSIRIS